MDENTLIENAILAFLHHYPEHKWVEDYKVILAKIKALKNAKPEDTTVQKRGRPAKRQRTKKASSNEASTKATQTPKEET